MMLILMMTPDFSLVYDIFCVTISVHGARVGFPAVTAFLLIVGGVDLLISALL